MRKEVDWTWRTVRDVEIVNVSFVTVLTGCRARCPECRPEIRVGASHAATAAVSSRPIADAADWDLLAPDRTLVMAYPFAVEA